MNRKWLRSMVCLLSVAVFASAARPDFSGTWELNPAKSQNIGMMSAMKMTETIRQSDSAFDIDTHTSFQGQPQDNKTHYDLTGKPASNEAPMSGPSETVSKWDGKKLVTTWTSPGAVAGSKTVRTETRSLSPEGNTMNVESVRGSNPPMVMVFDRKH